jgi:hypothetical protein
MTTLLAVFAVLAAGFAQACAVHSLRTMRGAASLRALFEHERWFAELPPSTPLAAQKVHTP